MCTSESYVKSYAEEKKIPFYATDGDRAFAVELPPEMTIDAGSSKALNWSFVPAGVKDTLTWKSSNSAVATVQNGTVKGLQSGTAVITAETKEGKKAECTVTVRVSVPQNLSVISADTIKLGQTVTVNAAAKGGSGNYTYAVYYKKHSAEKYSLVQDFSAKSKVTIKPQVKTTYDIRVIVRDGSGMSVQKDFSVKVAAPLQNLSVISAETLTYGKTLVIKGKYSGGIGPVQCGMYCKKHSSEKWSTILKYGSQFTGSFTPAVKTTYDVCVKVKDQDGQIVKKYFTVKVVS